MFGPYYIDDDEEYIRKAEDLVWTNRAELSNSFTFEYGRPENPKIRPIYQTRRELLIDDVILSVKAPWQAIITSPTHNYHHGGRGFLTLNDASFRIRSWKDSYPDDLTMHCLQSTLRPARLDNHIIQVSHCIYRITEGRKITVALATSKDYDPLTKYKAKFAAEEFHRIGSIHESWQDVIVISVETNITGSMINIRGCNRGKFVALVGTINRTKHKEKTKKPDLTDNITLLHPSLETCEADRPADSILLLLSPSFAEEYFTDTEKQRNYQVSTEKLNIAGNYYADSLGFANCIFMHTIDLLSKSGKLPDADDCTVIEIHPIKPLIRKIKESGCAIM